MSADGFMTEPAEPTVEEILRWCLEASPQPWYPSAYSKASGVPREQLDPILDRIRMAGIIRLTDWVRDLGQGYTLTPEGRDLLDDASAMRQVKAGHVPIVEVLTADHSYPESAPESS